MTARDNMSIWKDIHNFLRGKKRVTYKNFNLSFTNLNLFKRINLEYPDFFKREDVVLPHRGRTRFGKIISKELKIKE